MDSKRQRSTKNRAGKKMRMLQDRLTLIKARHRKLILKPRESILNGFFDEDEDALHMLEEPEEMHIFEAYALQAEM